MKQEWIYALFGGVLIGLSVSLMLLGNGRVTGISGIINGLFSPVRSDLFWRATFILGLILGGLVLRLINPKILENTLNSSSGIVVVAGLLVGFGTVMGSGCTSGHGVCGMSRLSVRSIVATGIFMMAGIFAVYLFKMIGVLS